MARIALHTFICAALYALAALHSRSLAADSRQCRCCPNAPSFWIGPALDKNELHSDELLLDRDAARPASGVNNGCGIDESLFGSDSDTLFDAIPHGTDWITGQVLYTGELLSNTRGGLNTNRATRFRGVLDLTLDVDFEAAGGPTGLSLFVAAGQMHGQSLSVRDVGDWQYISNIDSSPFPSLTQLNEYWLRQEFGDSGWIKGGRIDANATFAFADLAGDFVNNSFCQMPTVPLPVWPTQSLGVDGAINLNDDLSIVGGAYQGNTLAPNWGLPVAGDLGWVILGHLERRTSLGPDELQGTFRLGAFLQTGGWDEITPAAPGQSFNENYGFWATADQLIFAESNGDDSDSGDQGLGVFLELGWSPEDRNFVERSLGTGLVYRGLIHGRDEDTIGIGLARIEFGGRTTALMGLTSEDAIELFYKVQIRPWFAVQPDIQYIANPGGNGHDSLVAGFRFEAAL